MTGRLPDVRPWQFDALWFIGVGGTVLAVVAPYFGLDAPGPGALGGVGAILAFVLTQKDKITRSAPPPADPPAPTAEDTTTETAP